ncbi:hypothetical protein SNOG_10884 [Parastagonospora nodorum SN15]|uniref:Uncharacterized protein n=1 Tax=Phaeosphaeria nodorum (strain SN15 / ATCC MYA-4574 / FGSC 10173) TaxID=321614 RepID=Q0UBI0_PHANO|nr:hypothetical protein SNOG_10884 [Parastagonospora nodorum SN15]EAT81383.1 hypothetical protein SNOG_10884 [Parastagonospora nodorum SN15]
MCLGNWCVLGRQLWIVRLWLLMIKQRRIHDSRAGGSSRSYLFESFTTQLPEES